MWLPKKVSCLRKMALPRLPQEQRAFLSTRKRKKRVDLVVVVVVVVVVRGPVEAAVGAAVEAVAVAAVVAAVAGVALDALVATLECAAHPRPPSTKVHASLAMYLLRMWSKRAIR
jgi:TRAP-type mannitol/chloroaromatic compound transport system permease large subunit